jgi:hypothetical protein
MPVTMGLLEDIVEVRKTTGASNGGIKKVAIRCHVHLHDKVRTEDVHAKTVHANEATTPLKMMSPKTVQRVTEVWDVEAIPDEDLLTIEGDDGCTLAKDGGKRFVTHPNTPAKQDGRKWTPTYPGACGRWLRSQRQVGKFEVRDVARGRSPATEDSSTTQGPSWVGTPY